MNREDLEAWRKETSADFTLHHLDAGHFVLDEAMEIVADTLLRPTPEAM